MQHNFWAVHKQRTLYLSPPPKTDFCMLIACKCMENRVLNIFPQSLQRRGYFNESNLTAYPKSFIRCLLTFYD